MSNTPTPMVHVFLSVVGWEIVVMALRSAADNGHVTQTTCVRAGRMVLEHIAGHIQAELQSQQPT